MALPFASSEHQFTGSISLPKLGDKDYLFTLSIGVRLSFGSIVALAGDYYGVPDQPICLGKTPEERAKRFLTAFDTLDHAEDIDDMHDLIEMIDTERKHADDAINHHRPISSAINGCLLKKTANALENTNGKYFDLAINNLDHFAEEALIAYQTGHQLAMETAAAGQLARAYMLEAFACHFLTDLFAAGHMRTPRKALHEIFGAEVGGWLSLLQHNEDGNEGLIVTNQSGASWKAYGDGHLFENKSAVNRMKVDEAVKTAVAEVYAAYTSKNVPNIELSDINKLIPQPVAEKNFSPLFKYKHNKIFFRKETDNIHCQTYVELAPQKTLGFMSRYFKERLNEHPAYIKLEEFLDSFKSGKLYDCCATNPFLFKPSSKNSDELASLPARVRMGD